MDPLIGPFLSDIQLARAAIGAAVVAGTLAWGAMRAKLGKFPVSSLIRKIAKRED